MKKCNIHKNYSKFQTKKFNVIINMHKNKCNINMQKYIYSYGSKLVNIFKFYRLKKQFKKIEFHIWEIKFIRDKYMFDNICIETPIFLIRFSK